MRFVQSEYGGVWKLDVRKITWGSVREYQGCVYWLEADA